MLKTYDKTKTIEKLILNTSENKIKWDRTYGHTLYDTYKFDLKLTYKKKLQFNLYVNIKHIKESYMAILFYKNAQYNDYIGSIKCSEESLLYDLIEVLNEKYSHV